jgi:predicted protein tyrosine phosphatase
MEVIKLVGELEDIDVLFLDFIDGIDYGDSTKFTPKKFHLEKAFEFCHSLKNWGEKPLMIHCYAGQSRSTALALLVLAKEYPHEKIEDIIKNRITVSNNKKIIIPNMSMCDHGSKMLNRQDIKDCADKYFEESMEYGDKKLKGFVDGLNKGLKDGTVKIIG